MTDSEYSQLVSDCLELLRKNQMSAVAEKLEAIIAKPVVEEPPPSDSSSKHISEAKERPPTPKEQIQAIVAFLDAHLSHTTESVSRLAAITRHNPGSLKWALGEGMEGANFTATELTIDEASRHEIAKHLRMLREAVEMPLENLP